MRGALLKNPLPSHSRFSPPREMGIRLHIYINIIKRGLSRKKPAALAGFQTLFVIVWIFFFSSFVLRCLTLGFDIHIFFFFFLYSGGFSASLVCLAFHLFLRTRNINCCHLYTGCLKSFYRLFARFPGKTLYLYFCSFVRRLFFQLLHDSLFHLSCCFGCLCCYCYWSY
ncbi:hypothetical protein SAMN05518684_107146 [Salipaludibacillus aurantiacus]|uniref:Uncharacterized protein n=1 Tax=Salipaludibacillus aurantiacus TaxID=1601833 RepID=A0A1H9UEA5_9BACI|nr:hypothetical protein SAMN05518684_107146 [Salipaludibacillus aurantiacus]